MALHTTGTTATSSLRSFKVGGPGTNAQGLGAQNIVNTALVNAQVLNDLVNGNPIWPGAVLGLGGGSTTVPLAGGGCLLSIPNRGVLQCYNGDVIALDPATGWPILISARAFAGAQWNGY